MLHTPNEDARKVWISQGLTASQMVVVADLRVEGQSHGPHAFLMPLRDAESGELTAGVSVGDMGSKTVANDLDNAWISFDHVAMPRSALLDRFCTVDAEVPCHACLATPPRPHRDDSTGRKLPACCAIGGQCRCAILTQALTADRWLCSCRGSTPRAAGR